MPHGTPDWGLVGPKQTIYGLDDLGEHAVRMGSPHLWDRRGDVIWQTLFEQGLEGVEVWRGGAAPGASLWTGPCRQGAFCVRLEAGPLAADHIEIRKWLPFPRGSGLGIEFSFSSTATGGTVYGQLLGRDALGLFRSQIDFNVNDGNMYYWDNAGALIWFHQYGGSFAQPYIHNTLKFVIDAVTHRYVRCIINEEAAPLPRVEFEYAGIGVGPILNATVGLKLPMAADMPCYVDNVIVTQNEP